MFIAEYFVYFLIFSFGGWVFESIYCTAVEKHWADRGFLFGPICPIYGSCVVAAIILFQRLSSVTAGKELPSWKIFLICLLGSAIAEYLTSFVLEKRFHARWWDYSDMPLNINGRICLPASLLFGFAGVGLVRYVLPMMSGMHGAWPPALIETLALLGAAVFGADLALTEASLNALLVRIENMKEEMNEKAELTYERIAEAPAKLEAAIGNTQAMVESAVSSTSDMISSAVTTTSGKIGSAVTTTSGKIGSAVTTTSGKIGSAVTTTSGKIGSAVTTTSGKIGSAVTTTSGKIGSAVTTTSGKIGSAVTTTSGKIGSAVTTTSGKIGSAVTTTSGKIGSAVTTTSGKIAERYAAALTYDQKLVLGSIRRFVPKAGVGDEAATPGRKLKDALLRIEEGKETKK